MKRKTIRDRALKPSELSILALILGFVPLLFRVVPHQMTPDEKIWISNDWANDLYSLIKVRVLLVLTAIALLIFLYQIYKKRIHIQKSIYWIGAGIYGAAILLSTLTSEYDTALWGFTDRFEGMWVLLSYLVLFIVAMHYGRQEKAVRLLGRVFLVSSMVIGAIGIMQYYGYDPYTEGFLRYVSFPSQVWDTVGDTVVTSFEKGIVASLYNPNFMGSYAAMATLFSLSRLLEKPKEKREQYFLLAANLLALAALVGSRSSAGLVGFTIGLVLLVLFQPQAFMENKKQLGILLAAWAVIIATLMMSYSRLWPGRRLIQDDYLVICVFLVYFLAAAILYRRIFNSQEKNRKLAAISAGFAILVMIGAAFLYNPVESTILNLYGKEESVVREEEERTMLKELSVEEDRIHMVEESGRTLDVIVTGNTLQAVDENGNNLGFDSTESGHYQIVAEGYEDYEVVMTKISQREDDIFVTVPKFDIWAMITEDGLAYKGRNHLAASIDTPPSIGFEGRERFATYRGYIWSRTLPLIYDTVLIGAGPDAFVHVFPQYEHLAKWNLGITAYLLYDKPHNWYLQMAVNTGLLSMLAVLAMGIILLIQAGKQILIQGESKILSTALVSMVFAYAIAGVFNDSVVSVAPIFWIFFGLAVGQLNPLQQKAQVKKKK